MRTVKHNQLLSELPPLQLDIFSLGEMTFHVGRLVAIETIAENGKFIEVLSLESSHGIEKAAVTEGFAKERGLQLGRRVAIGSFGNWYDAEFVFDSVEQNASKAP